MIKKNAPAVENRRPPPSIPPARETIGMPGGYPLRFSAHWREFLVTTSRRTVRHDDIRPSPPVVSRLLQVEAAHPRPFGPPPAGLAQPALYQRRDESVRSHLSRPAETRCDP